MPVKQQMIVDTVRSFTEKELQLQCQKRLENFMVPRQIVFVPELPKTTTGKIKKTDLR